MNSDSAGSTRSRRRHRRSHRDRRRHRSRSYSSTSTSSRSSVERANWRHADSGMFFLDQLYNQVQVLTNFMHEKSGSMTGDQTNVGSESMNSQQPVTSLVPPVATPEISATVDQVDTQIDNDQEFSFKSLHTSLKDTGVNRTDPELFELINSLQLFGSSDWNNINFIETQKSYLSKPGFVELETNDDLKPFDKNKFLPSCERTLAAVSNAILLQRGILQRNVAYLLSYVKDSQTISYDDFSNKVNALFCEDKDYNKISNDIMQIICGKRASIINNRRTELMKPMQITYTVDKFKKIPPSSEFLFEPESFSKLLEKEGGPSKVFAKQVPKKNIPLPSSSKGQTRFPFKNQFLQPFRGTNNYESTGNPKPNSRNTSSRGKRKHESKKSHDYRHHDSKRRRYD